MLRTKIVESGAVILALAAFIPASADPNTNDPLGNLNQKVIADVNAISIKLRSGEISSVKIMAISPDFIQEGNASVATFRSCADFELFIRRPHDKPFFNDLIRALGELNIHSNGPKYLMHEPQPDIRWALLCFDKSNEEITSIFFDKLGDTAVINGNVVECKGPLLSCITSIGKNGFKFKNWPF